MPYSAAGIITPMPIFVIVGHTEIPKLGEAIKAAYPEGQHFELPPSTWFVRHEYRSVADVASKIGISDGKLGAQAIVFTLGGWSGWARNELWEWMRALEYEIGAVERPHSVECNVCNLQARELGDDIWHARSKCRGCGSEVRHRLLVAALSHVEPFSYAKLIDGKEVLHFAPEPALFERLRSRARRYVTADYLRPGFDRKLDICSLDLVDNEFDTLIACDVLEHVADDRRAIREIRRVLRPGGTAILTVPQKDGAPTTFEDASVIDPQERLRLFGQEDHVRIYGADFVTRLEEVGFKVGQVGESNFTKRDVARFVLFPPVLSTHPLATNHRKVFFAQK
jgi:SAM-dependent methyltransferase